ncbi:MAG: A24 family peptidase [Robiginitomaculum sp.]|nr:A24 family peptidase [Robiginitomaculum sp.]MDQ7076318.1 A24 family peptidase [Robiginitomaculum sp.]
MSALPIFNNGWLSLFLLLTGPFLGSFISASALTWPDRSNLRTSRSQCAQCGAELTLVDLVPLFSFFLLRGRCRHCKTSIRRQHIIAELASTSIALSSVLVFDGWIMLASTVFGMVLLFIALVDYRTRLIPDGASFFLIGSGPLIMYLLHGDKGLKTSLAGAIIGYGIFWLVAFAYRHLRGREGLGMGDAKLLAGGGAWMGPFALPWIVLLAASTAIVGLLVGSKGKSLHRETELPFGPALALAIYAIWLWSSTNNANLILL